MVAMTTTRRLTRRTFLFDQLLSGGQHQPEMEIGLAERIRRSQHLQTAEIDAIRATIFLHRRQTSVELVAASTQLVARHVAAVVGVLHRSLVGGGRQRVVVIERDNGRGHVDWLTERQQKCAIAD